jgi:hypothetical protein
MNKTMRHQSNDNLTFPYQNRKQSAKTCKQNYRDEEHRKDGVEDYRKAAEG